MAVAGMRRNRNDRPTKNSPKANFVGVVGSYLPRRIHIQANTGASRITKIAWTDKVGEALEVFTANADGSNAKQVTKLGGLNSYAAWAPDGSP